ncbi:hypothetical protein HGM15179_000186, partial [Zosterops borbonicus]
KSININGLYLDNIDKEIKCTLKKFVDETKLSDVTDTPEVRNAIQWDVNKPRSEPMGIP